MYYEPCLFAAFCSDGVPPPPPFCTYLNATTLYSMLPRVERRRRPFFRSFHRDITVHRGVNIHGSSSIPYHPPTSVPFALSLSLSLARLYTSVYLLPRSAKCAELAGRDHDGSDDDKAKFIRADLSTIGSRSACRLVQLGRLRKDIFFLHLTSTWYAAH